VHPIVVDSRGLVRAGNGRLEAARALGWKTIDIVRSDLPLAELAAFAVADNRTAELAGWDNEILLNLLSEPDIGDLSFSELELAALRKDARTFTFGLDDETGEGERSDADGPAAMDNSYHRDETGDGKSAERSSVPSRVDEKWLVVVTCRDEADQRSLLEELAAAGRECKALLG
jgi:ParB-like chromosome segregation protein Spo0J